MLLGRRLEVVNLSQFGSDIPVGLLPGQLVLIVVPRPLVASFPLDFQHVRYVHLMRLQAHDLSPIVPVVSIMSFMTIVLLWLIAVDVSVGCIPEDDPVESRKVYIFGLRVVCKRNWVLLLGAHAQLCVFLVLMPILVV